MEIRQVEEENIESIVPLLRMLDPNIKEEILISRVREMTLQGYLCVGAYDENELIGICGFWLLTKYYIGKHVEPDNLFVLPKYRSRGIGKKLLNWIYKFSVNHDCDASELNCYVKNTIGNEFWLNEGYEVIANHYRKKFQP